ncbi:conserved hypothetical protein [Flavobacterium sp. 9AF]|uniref:C40 family peptidase n=1 Tax=Flavobacterium sp. 9AF TaxID=2653142 RepID=UPI0012EFF667|nr:C40 family peptidase [Flavobacterium sp. 9AF]VXB64582.1 conserved hypothetical protein [Flavobacterium sp. 9AF]
MNKLKIISFFIIVFNNFSFGQNQDKHKVVSGETIYAIARKYNTSVENIYQLNPSLKGKSLQINSIVNIPKNTIQIVENQNKPKSHKVTKGESLYSISKKYDLAIEDLQALNPSVNPKKIKPGMLLTIQPESNVSLSNQQDQTVAIVSEAKEEKNEKEKNTIVLEVKNNDSFTIFHSIKPKETKYGIAKLYGITIHELEVLNPNLPSDFPVGYELVIKKDNENIAATNSNSGNQLSYEEEETVEKMSSDFNSKADFLIEKASQYIGIKYKFGGTTPNGFDCSGLMCTTFKEIDLNLPRSSVDQAKYGEKIALDESQKGDLIFFATGSKKRISHVGLITEVNEDEIKFIHSSTSSGVMISSSKEPYYASRIVQVNRVLSE